MLFGRDASSLSCQDQRELSSVDSIGLLNNFYNGGELLWKNAQNNSPGPHLPGKFRWQVSDLWHKSHIYLKSLSRELMYTKLSVSASIQYPHLAILINQTRLKCIQLGWTDRREYYISMKCTYKPQPQLPHSHVSFCQNCHLDSY